MQQILECLILYESFDVSCILNSIFQLLVAEFRKFAFLANCPHQFILSEILKSSVNARFQ